MQRSSRRRHGCRTWRKRRRDYGGRWGPGQMLRRQVRTFRRGVWRWWRHSVFAPLALLVSGIRARGCSFTSPRDRTGVWRVAVFCVDEYRCVVLRGFTSFCVFCVCLFCVLCLTECRSDFMRFFVFCAGDFLLFLREMRKTPWKSVFLHRVDRISKKYSSIVDSPRSSISLASRLSHKKTNCRPQRELFIWDKPASFSPRLFRITERSVLLTHALSKGPKPFCRVHRTAGTGRGHARANRYYGGDMGI